MSVRDESLFCCWRLTNIFSPGKLTVSFSSFEVEWFWTDQKRFAVSKQTHRRRITRENSAAVSWLVTSDFRFEERKLQTSLCGAGLWFWTANGRDTLIGGFEAIWIDVHSSNAFGWVFCTGHVEKAGLATSGSLFSRILEGLSSHSDGAWIHI